jgi:hypothetical protein
MTTKYTAKREWPEYAWTTDMPVKEMKKGMAVEYTNMDETTEKQPYYKTALIYAMVPKKRKAFKSKMMFDIDGKLTVVKIRYIRGRYDSSLVG